MRYAQMRKMDISNGEGIGVALFTQGCPFHCKGCFNPETWDFNGGKEWTDKEEKEFLELMDRPYIKRISFLGGEPLAEQNDDTLPSLIMEIKMQFPDKKIWVYSGNVWENLKDKPVMKYIDVLVDGPFVEELKDLTLPFRGSSNQRIIDVQKSLNEGKVIKYLD